MRTAAAPLTEVRAQRPVGGAGNCAIDHDAPAPATPRTLGHPEPTTALYTSDRCATVAASPGFSRVTYCGTGAESLPLSRTRP